MAARDVADLLAIAHEGAVQARRTGDRVLLNRSIRLAGKALAHRDAPTFFTGLQVALAEVHRDDETEGDRVIDGGANAEAPVDAGAMPHDEKLTRADRDHADALEPLVEQASATGDLRQRALAALR